MNYAVLDADSKQVIDVYPTKKLAAARSNLLSYPGCKFPVEPTTLPITENEVFNGNAHKDSDSEWMEN